MKIEQLTFTRFLAAISIVIFHFGKKSFLFNNTIVKSLFFNADVCVSYFFILSGFVMMLAYGNKSFICAKEYFRNRFSRIYPLYFFAILLVLFLQIRIKNFDLLGLILSLFMIQAWIPGYVLIFNPPGWSLSVELIFYLIFPFVFNRFFKKERIEKIYLIIIGFWILSQIIFLALFPVYNDISNFKDFLMYSPIMHLNEFLIGNLAGFIFVRKIWHRIGNYDIPIFILSIILFFALKLPINFHNGLLAVLFIPLIILISLNTGIITKTFKMKSFVFLGEISYGIYILQVPIFSLFSAYSVNKYFHITDPTIVFFLRLIILILVAALCYIYIEKPIQEKIRAKQRTTSVLSNSNL
ncbi:acyltransferase family protein [Flavobacterium phragmitis]|uniref:Peptidoglycan/LPS O-acetylase OafA/YrhL, contains acyltransferase and SGNH-hydrolase domains n=1 Tax=Flavobacterium phragmitis TaxID=739143 RepID=A0A1I1USD0_9FLAO|nr:acyltransferase [Flavobacterium phragmitis]SFD72578.1 Peptidoglycan/LPS O-acetylase OafA/YrhL, contains acyltransferase and SGNH-hydrolase domains [Flavobacterium phragmitis]